MQIILNSCNKYLVAFYILSNNDIHWKTKVCINVKLWLYNNLPILIKATCSIQFSNNNPFMWEDACIYRVLQNALYKSSAADKLEIMFNSTIKRTLRLQFWVISTNRSIVTHVTYLWDVKHLSSLPCDQWQRAHIQEYHYKQYTFVVVTQKWYLKVFESFKHHFISSLSTHCQSNS